MILKMYTIYDSKVKSFASQTPPFFMRSTGEAIRFWQDTVNAKDNAISKHPEDYSLMELGEFDDQSGEFIIPGAPINLGLASSFIKHEAQQIDISDLIKAKKGNT